MRGGFLLLVLACLPVSAIEISQCRMPNGSVLFTDRDCAPGVLLRADTSELTSPAAPKGLSVSEVKRIHAFQARRAERARAINQSHRQYVQLRALARLARIEECEHARSAVRQLRKNRSRGYSVGDTNRLNREQDRLNSVIKSSCG